MSISEFICTNMDFTWTLGIKNCTFSSKSLLILHMGHLSPLANSNDKKDSVISDLEHWDDGKPATESEPASGRSEERVSWHRPVPGHLQVIRVLQENLTQQFSLDVERKMFSYPDNKKVVLCISCNSVFKLLFNSFDSWILVRIGRVEKRDPLSSGSASSTCRLGNVCALVLFNIWQLIATS